MNRSTFCEMKYMNRLFFLKAWVYDWGWFQNTDSDTRTKMPRAPPPPPPPPTHTHNYRGYERVYKFKEQYMNRSTVCKIKYMKRLGFFSKARYMLGVGFKILTHSPVPTFPESPIPPSPRVSLSVYVYCLKL